MSGVAAMRHDLQALGPGHHLERAVLLLRVAEELRVAGDAPAARAAFVDAARHARSIGDAALLAEAALGYGLGSWGLHRAVRCDLAQIALLEEALLGLGQAESSLRVRVLARLSEELAFTPEIGAHELGEEAVALAQRLGDDALLLTALRARALGHLGPDVSLEDRLDEAAEIMTRGRAAHDAEASYTGHVLRELGLAEAGRFREAVPDLDEAAQFAGLLAVPALQVWALVARVRQEAVAGRFAQAEELNARAGALAVEQGGEPAVTHRVVEGQRLSLQLLRSDRATLTQTLTRPRTLQPEFVPLRCLAAYVRCSTGDVEGGRRALVAALPRGLTNVPRNADWVSTMWAVARTAILLDDVGLAGRVYAELSPLSGRWHADWAGACFGPVDTCLGMLASLCHFPAVADVHFSAALQQTAAAGSAPWTADAQVQQARVLLHRRGTSSRAKGQRLLVEALSTCARLELDGLAEQARALLG